MQASWTQLAVPAKHVSKTWQYHQLANCTCASSSKRSSTSASSAIPAVASWHLSTYGVHSRTQSANRCVESLVPVASVHLLACMLHDCCLRMYAERTQIIKGVVSVRDAAHKSCALPRCVQQHLNARVARFNACIVRGLFPYHPHSPICLLFAQHVGLEALISPDMLRKSRQAHTGGRRAQPSSQAVHKLPRYGPDVPSVTLLLFEWRESRIHAMPNAS